MFMCMTALWLEKTYKVSQYLNTMYSPYKSATKNWLTTDTCSTLQQRAQVTMSTYMT